MYLSDDVAIFSVNLSQGAEFLACRHDVYHLAICHLHHVFVRHKHLERIHTFERIPIIKYYLLS